MNFWRGFESNRVYYYFFSYGKQSALLRFYAGGF
jgi:hypothetical protein